MTAGDWLFFAYAMATEVFWVTVEVALFGLVLTVAGGAFYYLARSIVDGYRGEK